MTNRIFSGRPWRNFFIHGVPAGCWAISSAYFPRASTYIGINDVHDDEEVMKNRTLVEKCVTKMASNSDNCSVINLIPTSVSSASSSMDC
jgi:hypothetical protein